jgi:hypothetical protein
MVHFFCLAFGAVCTDACADADAGVATAGTFAGSTGLGFLISETMSGFWWVGLPGFEPSDRPDVGLFFLARRVQL